MTHPAHVVALCRCLHPSGVHLDDPAVSPEPLCLTCFETPLTHRAVPHWHAFTALDTGPVVEAGTDLWDPYWWAPNREDGAATRDGREPGQT